MKHCILQIWSTSSLNALFVIHPYGETDAGDIYSLAFSYTPAPPSAPSSDEAEERKQSGSRPEKDRATLFFGCQNTSLQWIDLSSATLSPSPSSGRSRPKDARLQAVISGEGETTAESSSDYDYGAELEYEYEFDFDSAGDEDEEDEDEDTILVSDDHDHPTDDSLPSPSQQRPRPQPSLRKRQSTPRQQQMRPPKKPHKFFDSQPRGSQSRLPTLSNGSGLSRIGSSSSIDSTTQPTFTSRTKRAQRRSPRVLRVPASNVLESAHYGYIYCMTLVPTSSSPAGAKPFGDYTASAPTISTSNSSSDWGEIRFVSGSGDEDVKLWSFNPSPPSPFSSSSSSPCPPAPILQRTFNLPPLPTICPETISCGGAVLSVLVRNNCVYAGCQDGLVVVWGLDDGSLVRCMVGKEVSLPDVSDLT